MSDLQSGGGLAAAAAPSAEEEMPSWLVEDPPPAPPAPSGGGYAAPPPMSWQPDKPTPSPMIAPPPPSSAAPPPAAAAAGGYAPPVVGGGPATKSSLIMTMRLLNMGVSVLMSAAACLKLMSLPAFNTGIMAMYIWFFAILLCCFETHLKQVSRIICENFGFLYHVKGRIAFFLLLSMLCFGLGLIGLISGIGLLLCAAYNAYVIWKHPEYEREMIEADAEQRGPGSAGDVYAHVYAPPGRPSGDHQRGDWLSGAGAAASANPELAAAVGTAAYGWARENPDAARSVAASAAGAYHPPPV